jgi:acetamidase/formamidase
VPRVHHVTADQAQSRWDKRLPPVLEIEPGDTVVFETPDSIDGQITPESGPEVLLSLDFDPIHQVNGPVLVQGAEAGDTLVVDIIDIKPGTWGWTAIIPSFGLLQEDDAFKKPYLHFWDLTSGSYAEFKPGIRVPFEPFCGVMAVAPVDDEPLVTLPPRVNGGNVDIKQAQPGSTVYLPVLVDGALFSIGDVHAAQGDGEVCGSAIECQAAVTVQIDLMKGHQMPELAITLDGQMPGAWNTAGWMITTAHGPDLFAASQQAIRYMIDYIARSQKLSMQEAYVLCSACVDLKISEIVDAPNWIVSASLPLGIFSGRQ